MVPKEWSKLRFSCMTSTTCLISLGLKLVGAVVAAIARCRLGGSATEAAVAPPSTAAPVSSLRRDKREVSRRGASSDNEGSYQGTQQLQLQSHALEAAVRSTRPEEPEA